MHAVDHARTGFVTSPPGRVARDCNTCRAWHVCMGRGRTAPCGKRPTRAPAVWSTRRNSCGRPLHPTSLFPPPELTIGELNHSRLQYDSGGYTVIESKKAMRACAMKCPDRAEAVLLAVYEPDPIICRGGGLLV